MEILCAVRLSTLEIIPAQVQFRLSADLSIAHRDSHIAHSAEFSDADCKQGFAVPVMLSVLCLSLSPSLSLFAKRIAAARLMHM